MKRQLIRLGAASTVAGLILGTAAVAGASSISDTGPHSTNEVEHNNNLSLRITNDNNVRLTNNNPQYATSGDVRVGGGGSSNGYHWDKERHCWVRDNDSEGNTNGGSAQSGDATNDSQFNADVNIDNSGSGLGGLLGHMNGGTENGSIDTTGPNSRNEIEFNNRADVNVRNDNNVTLTNNNTQRATSGDATVSGNTHGGDAVSGNASNTSSASFEVNITN